MAFDCGIFGRDQLQENFVEWLIEEKGQEVQKHFSRLWEYYQNQSRPISEAGIEAGISESARMYVQAQEYGLPSRITGITHFAEGDVFSGRAADEIQRKEVVIENDIAWRVNAMVDFLFGKEIQIVSKAPGAGKRAEIDQIIKALFEANGAIGFFQDMAVLGGVYGFVDCLIRTGDDISTLLPNSSKLNSCGKAIQAAQNISLELIEAPRALPILDENDYKKLKFYVQNFVQLKNEVKSSGYFLTQVLSRPSSFERERVSVTEIIGPGAWQRYENKEMVGEGLNPLGFIPVVHIQNIAQPYFYEGLSDIEQLIPLQDELNTRLSDRASRITFQSFKMYLAKGIEGMGERPVAPGRMWYTDNTEASIETFGGDASSPSEDMHISETREALDKASGVTPVVAGILRNKLGNLTSAVALRLAMIGTLAKTDRKRFTYGQGIKRICRMVLEIMDKSGVYQTGPEERDFEIIFPSPVPENLLEKLQEAQIKKELGVPQQQVLRELGYETQEKEAL